MTDDAAERLRKNVAALLGRNGTSMAALSRALDLNRRAVSRKLSSETPRQDFTLRQLDELAAYFGMPASALVQAPGTTLVEVTSVEARLLDHWRAWPADVQERMFVLLDFFGGMLPEEKEQRRWWQKIQRIRNARDREYLERTIDDVLRAQRIERDAPDAPGQASSTVESSAGGVAPRRRSQT